MRTGWSATVTRTAKSYLSLKERLLAGGLPYDDYAERCAIGALLAAPADHAKRIGKRLWRDHFYLDQHGWLWNAATFAMGKCEWNDRVSLYLWVRKDKWIKRYRERFSGSLVALVESCLRDAYWWHGPYYCDRVVAAAKLRGRIKRAASELAETLNEADRGWIRGQFTPGAPQ
jgi:replicative DNA helicase